MSGNNVKFFFLWSSAWQPCDWPYTQSSPARWAIGLRLEIGPTLRIRTHIINLCNHSARASLHKYADCYFIGLAHYLHRLVQYLIMWATSEVQLSTSRDSWLMSRSHGTWDYNEVHREKWWANTKVTKSTSIWFYENCSGLHRNWGERSGLSRSSRLTMILPSQATWMPSIAQASGPYWCW